MKWNQNIGEVERIWFTNSKNNRRIICLTRSDSLFTLELNTGEILNKIAMDSHDYSVHFDHTNNAVVLVNSQFIVGVDPLNGEQLWKVKDVDIESNDLSMGGIKSVALNSNTIFVTKPVFQEKVLLINNYNRDNGSLIWSEILSVNRSMRAWNIEKPHSTGFNLLEQQYPVQYYNINQGLILVLHDEIIKLNTNNENIDVVAKKDVKLSIARSFAANNKPDSAIKEYTEILDYYDQTNQDIYWEMANLYQKQNNLPKAISSLLDYYDLVLSNSRKGVETVRRLQKLSGLRWERKIFKDDWEDSAIQVDDERIFRFLHNYITQLSFHAIPVTIPVTSCDNL